MEFRLYVDIIRRRRWIVLTAFTVTILATLVFVMPQPKVYQSTGTYVVGPRADNSEESLKAFDTLIRGDAINATYASVARSDFVRARAEDQVDPSIDTSDIHVSAEERTGTNILSISVRGPDPESVQELAVAVGNETIGYVARLDDAYKLEPLDSPKLPRSPVAPKKYLTISIGVLFGGLLGIILALVVDFVVTQLGSGGAARSESTLLPALDEAIGLLDAVEARTTSRKESPHPTSRADADTSRGGTDDSQDVARATAGEKTDLVAAISSVTGSKEALSGEGSFAERLRHEMNRAVQHGESLNFGRLIVTAKGTERGKHRPAPITVYPTLREGDFIGRLDDGSLGVVLLDMSAAEVESLLLDWKMAVASIVEWGKNAKSPTLHAEAGVCEYRDGQFTGDQKAVQVAEALVDLRPTSGEVLRDSLAQVERAV